MSCNFYQIAYSEESLTPIHPDFKIFNQIGKPYLDERETSHMIDFFDAGHVKDDGNFYSLVSPKFINKLKVDFTDLNLFINRNDGSDLILFNTDPKWAYFFFNAWDQGESFHRGLKKIAGMLNTSSNFIRFDSRHEPKNLVYSNYWAAKYSFWKKYVLELKKTRKKILCMKADKKEYFYRKAENHFAPIYPFVMERMLSNYLSKNPKINCSNYPYSKLQVIKMATNITDKIILWKYIDIIDTLDNNNDYKSLKSVIEKIDFLRSKVKHQNNLGRLLTNVNLLFK
jgi:hypothetical protein